VLLVGDEKEELLSEVWILAEMFEGIFAVVDCVWV
jgi:hypothetical protein